ncbi:MAG: AAA family ATPase [Bacillota bacterium]
MWKLKRVKVAGFRSFNESREVFFEENLTLIYGPNGYGKTGLAEAIEWLFFGTTLRKLFTRSKNELKNSLRNVHYPAAEVAFVEIEISDAGASHTLRRELIDDDNSKAFLDGKPVKDFACLGIRVNTQNPVLPQHALTEFINTEPANRWSALSQFLGLELVNAYRSSLKTAITEFKNNNLNLLQQLEHYEQLVSQYSWKDVVKALRAGDTVKTELAIGQIAATELGLKAVSVQTLQQYRDKVLSEARWLPKSIEQIAVTLSKAGEFENRLDAVTVSFGQLVELWPKFLGLSTAKATAAELEFIRAGLRLKPKPPDCPFCGKPFLTKERLSELREADELNHSALMVRDATRAAIDSFKGQVEFLLDRLADSVVLSDDQPQEIAAFKDRLTDDLRGSLLNFINRSKCAGQRILGVKSDVAGIVERLNDLIAAEKDDKNLWPRSAKALEELKLCVESARELPIAANELQKALMPLISKQAFESQKVKVLSVLIELVSNLDLLKKALYVRRVIAEAQGAYTEAEDAEREMVKSRLEDKKKDTVRWYQLLHPKEQVSFSDMQPVKIGPSRQVQLFGVTFGKTMPAIAVLSESHLNALGLSVHLAKTMTADQSLGFVVLDDPVQSMDQAHRNRLGSEMIDELLKAGYQVVVMSHLKRFNGAVQEYHFLHSREVRSYEISEYTIGGPRLDEIQKSLESFLQGAEKHRVGGSESREIAGSYLRKAVERFYKELYAQGTGKPLPGKYRNETTSNLKKLAISSGLLLPTDEAKLDLVLTYANPSSHDSMDVEPPTAQWLQQGINLLTELSSRLLRNK